ncbi:SAM-dependent methyltransferase [Nocardiopsis terrae]
MTDTPIDSTVAHTARVWNYWLGGKDNYPVDREIGDRVKELFPQVADVAVGDRLFLRRAVTYATGEEGIRQFLDIGTGLPTADNTHEVAQALNPEARVVYVDNDPLVLTHARALLVGSEAGRTQFVGEDLRDTEAALPAGSLVAVCDGVFADEGAAAPDENALEGMRLWQEHVAQPYVMRTVPEFHRFFEGLELVDPGVVSVFHWRPGPDEADRAPELPQYAGLAKKV